MLSNRRPSSSLRSFGNDENANVTSSLSTRKTMGRSSSMRTSRSAAGSSLVNDENAFGLVSRSGKQSASLSSRKSSAAPKQKKVFGRDSSNAASKQSSTTPSAGGRRRALGDISNRKQNGGAGGKQGNKNRRDVLGGLPIKGGVVKEVPSTNRQKRVSFRKSNDAARNGGNGGDGRQIQLPPLDSVAKRTTDEEKRSDQDFEATSLSEIVSAFDDEASEVEDVELPAGRLYGEGGDFWRDEGPVCSFDLEEENDPGYLGDQDRAYQLAERERAARADAAHRKEMDAFLAQDDDDWNALVKDVGDRILDFSSGDDDSFGMSSSFGLDIAAERRDDDISL